jgi:diacylglycerol kinase family enzyme
MRGTHSGNGPPAAGERGGDRGGVIFANLQAGAESELDPLQDLLAPERVERCDPDDLVTAVREATRATPAFVGIAGGDGSVRAAAEVLAHTTVPLLVVPTGTLNHFAGDLGVDSPAAAADAMRAATVRVVDVGTVNGRVFMNNLGVGQYPAMVRRREQQRRQRPKWVRTAVAVVGQLRHGRKFDVIVDGVAHRAWAVFVGNGRYGTTLGDLARRDSLADGLLDVRVVDATGRLARLRVLAAVLTGRLDRSPLVHAFSTTSVRVHLHRPVIDVAVDGEVLRLVPPLEVTCHVGALRVLAPDPDG